MDYLNPIENIEQKKAQSEGLDSTYLQNKFSFNKLQTLKEKQDINKILQNIKIYFICGSMFELLEKNNTDSYFYYLCFGIGAGLKIYVKHNVSLQIFPLTIPIYSYGFTDEYYIFWNIGYIYDFNLNISKELYFIDRKITINKVAIKLGLGADVSVIESDINGVSEDVSVKFFGVIGISIHIQKIKLSVILQIKQQHISKYMHNSNKRAGLQICFP